MWEQRHYIDKASLFALIDRFGAFAGLQLYCAILEMDLANAVRNTYSSEFKCAGLEFETEGLCAGRLRQYNPLFPIRGDDLLGVQQNPLPGRRALSCSRMEAAKRRK